MRFDRLPLALHGIQLTVVYTDRAEAGDVVRRIISARMSSRNERQAYRKVFPTSKDY